MLGSVLDPWEIIGDFKSVYNSGLKAPKFLENKMIKKGLVYRKLEGVKQNELPLFLEGKHPDEFVYREITRVELHDGTTARYLSEYYGPESFFEGEPERLTPEEKSDFQKLLITRPALKLVILKLISKKKTDLSAWDTK
ncbi:hypothetical protein E3N88_35128 [Mikania micrantha]|uniref:Uncharacterized protein n=1 Tax=Mikania micrantha TaxID=192012 RepID=A0A5N6M086_9ASTR|nr:hypothetical protein E3N88_35128 [Mikania micrantha]